MVKGTWLKILGWGDNLGLSRCTQGNDKSPYGREAGGSKSVIDVMIEARGWIDSRTEPQAQECRWPLEAEKGKEIVSPLRAPGRNQPFQHLDFSPVRLILDF